MFQCDRSRRLYLPRAVFALLTAGTRYRHRQADCQHDYHYGGRRTKRILKASSFSLLVRKMVHRQRRSGKFLGPANGMYRKTHLWESNAFRPRPGPIPGKPCGRFPWRDERRLGLQRALRFSGPRTRRRSRRRAYEPRAEALGLNNRNRRAAWQNPAQPPGRASAH